MYDLHDYLRSFAIQ